MSVTEAATLIGCHPRHLRSMITAGKVKAQRKNLPYGYTYTLTRKEAERVRDNPPSRGWPRGKPRGAAT